jgi:sulfite reductase (NADPH) flavoprotein alpha-component
MLEEVKLNELNYFVERLSREELVWLNGYVSGLIKNSFQTETKAEKPAGKLTITYGTETGNSKKLATDFATKARKQGHTVKLTSLDQYRLADLSKEENFISVISTHGEGEPPASAKKFFNHIHETKLDLSNLHYAVLALGDSAYPLFCKAGEEVDRRFAALGGKRILSLLKCDVDFETDASEWFNNVAAVMGKSTPSIIAQKKLEKKTGKKSHTGTIISKVNLNGRGSAKETFHIEIAADDLVYQPGDSIGVIPKNKPEEVEAIIQFLDADANKIVQYKDAQFSLSQLLTDKLAISYLPERIVSKYAAIVNQNIPSVRIDLIDLLKIYPPQDDAQVENILLSLESITPRLYSISSSLLAHNGEVHITVARNCFQVNDVTQHGLCSDYLSRLSENSSFEFYIHKNLQFRLPSPDKNIILIGPGTGIAPFRAFIEERGNTGAEGKSWLFFGDQHFECDFLYQTEWQDHLKTGGLAKMNVAFSRDQQEKIYVQHKMLLQSVELFQWIDSGAFLYICGAKEPMSNDVEKALLEIIKIQGSKNEEQANAYLNQLIEEGRYLKDVY